MIADLGTVTVVGSESVHTAGGHGRIDHVATPLPIGQVVGILSERLGPPTSGTPCSAEWKSAGSDGSRWTEAWLPEAPSGATQPGFRREAVPDGTGTIVTEGWFGTR